MTRLPSPIAFSSWAVFIEATNLRNSLAKALTARNRLTPGNGSADCVPRFGAIKTKPCCFRFDWRSPYCPLIRLQTPEPP